MTRAPTDAARFAMPDKRIRIARGLVTATALFLAIVPPLADFNATHAANPSWPAHARLHTVWLVVTNSLLALLALGLLWRRPQQPTRAGVFLATALLGSVLLGFFLAAATQSAYGGAFTDPNGIPFRVGPLDANLVGFAVMALVLAAGVAAASSAGARGQLAPGGDAPFEVRRARPGDERLWLSAVESILSQEQRDGGAATHDEVASALADARCHLLLAASGGTPLGLLSAYVFPDVAAGGHLAYLYDVEVAPSHRRQGIGAALVDALAASCREDGVRLIWAGTDAGNRAARRTFERTGAECEGDRYIEYEWEIE